MPRTPQEIFDHHLTALLARDVDELLLDYTDDSALVTAAGDVLLLEWTLDARGSRGGPSFTSPSSSLAEPPGSRGGVDTFLFDGDSIRLQTISQRVQPKG